MEVLCRKPCRCCLCTKGCFREGPAKIRWRSFVESRGCVIASLARRRLEWKWLMKVIDASFLNDALLSGDLCWCQCRRTYIYDSSLYMVYGTVRCHSMLYVRCRKLRVFSGEIFPRRLLCFRFEAEWSTWMMWCVTANNPIRFG